MKVTKNMKYEKSVEARELMLYAANNAELYSDVISTARTLSKKLRKGIYDHELAVALWYRFACEASRHYNNDFGYSFAVGDRFTAAVDLEEYFFDLVEDLAELE